MKHTSMIGLRPGELEWLKLLVRLLRHQDPVVVELTKQAMGYLEIVSQRPETNLREVTQFSLAKH